VRYLELNSRCCARVIAQTAPGITANQKLLPLIHMAVPDLVYNRTSLYLLLTLLIFSAADTLSAVIILDPVQLPIRVNFITGPGRQSPRSGSRDEFASAHS
jgi:hypothetical protein